MKSRKTTRRLLIIGMSLGIALAPMISVDRLTAHAQRPAPAAEAGPVELIRDHEEALRRRDAPMVAEMLGINVDEAYRRLIVQPKIAYLNVTAQANFNVTGVPSNSRWSATSAL
jgi:hypothetical protein